MVVRNSLTIGLVLLRTQQIVEWVHSSSNSLLEGLGFQYRRIVEWVRHSSKDRLLGFRTRLPRFGDIRMLVLLM
jgi:hypothetical protein